MSLAHEGTKLTVIRRALQEAFSLPFAILFASFAGFGSLAKASDFPLEAAVVATIGIWGLPGQVVLAELHGAGADIAAIVIGVSMANARFLLMVISFLPMVRTSHRKRNMEFVLAQLLSTFSWAAGRRVFPLLNPSQRVTYFLAYALVCISGAITGTAAGYIGAAVLPRPVGLAILFLNPVFFALVFADSRERHVIIALVLGAAAGPPLHALSPDWGITIAGITAGTAAFWLTSTRSKDSVL
jgi:predicted branched-subunit amino acid permease